MLGFFRGFPDEETYPLHAKALDVRSVESNAIALYLDKPTRPPRFIQVETSGHGNTNHPGIIADSCSLHVSIYIPSMVSNFHCNLFVLVLFLFFSILSIRQVILRLPVPVPGIPVEIRLPVPVHPVYL